MGAIAVRSKEEADHSLPYILAVALIDSQVMPPQYPAAARLRRAGDQIVSAGAPNPACHHAYRGSIVSNHRRWPRAALPVRAAASP
jgi:hypothetical protein